MIVLCCYCDSEIITEPKKPFAMAFSALPIENSVNKSFSPVLRAWWGGEGGRTRANSVCWSFP